MRYYAPWLSRWMNPDPARFLDGLCLYQYCKSSPIKYFDPKGLGSDPGKHVVKKGDTYWSLAKNSGKNYSVEDLKSWNQGVDWKNLQRGSQIRTSMPQGQTSNTSTSTNPVGVKLSKDRDPDASQYQKYSFWWWAERGQYAAAFNTLDRDVQKAGAPVAEYISSYFVQLAKDVEKVATGVNPDNRKDTLNIASRIYIGGKVIAEILSFGASAKLKGGMVVFKAHTNKELAKNIGKAVLEHHKDDLLQFFLGRGPEFEAAEEKHSKVARPDALYVAPVQDLFKIPIR
jgi:hypothetical protein